MLETAVLQVSTQITRPINGEVFKSNYYLSWLSSDLIILAILGIIFLILLSFYIRNKIGMLFSSIIGRKPPTKEESEQTSVYGETPSRVEGLNTTDNRNDYPLQRPQGLMD